MSSAGLDKVIDLLKGSYQNIYILFRLPQTTMKIQTPQFKRLGKTHEQTLHQKKDVQIPKSV